jgi:hypothetical protein
LPGHARELRGAVVVVPTYDVYFDFSVKGLAQMRKLGPPWLWAIALVVMLLIAGVALRYISIFSSRISASQETWGQFGDYFGGVLNPILSFFAFCALLYTVNLQLKASSEASKRHDEQLFEGRLFKILSANFDIAISLRLQIPSKDGSHVYEGIRAVNYSWYDFSTTFLSQIEVGYAPQDQYAHVSVMLKTLKRKYGPVISTYFDSVIFIVEFTRGHANSNEQTAFAMHALRSQMTSAGRGLLFYYLLCSEQHCSLIPVLMQMSFFDDASDDPLASHRNQLFEAAAAYHQS